MFIKGFPYIFIYTPFLHIYSPVVNISATSLVPPRNLVPLSWRNRLKNHALSLLYDRRSNVTMWKSPQITPMFIRGFNYIFHRLYILWCLRHTWWSPIIPGAFSCFVRAFWCFFPTSSLGQNDLPKLLVSVYHSYASAFWPQAHPHLYQYQYPKEHPAVPHHRP